jgi:PAS domain-containing protein
MSGRYRFVLIEDPGVTLPVRYQRTRRFPPPVWVRADPLDLLLEAFWRLSRRGEGEQAWAPSLQDDPLTFLLDAVSDAITLRESGGRLLYANPAARALAGLPESRSYQALEVLQLGDRRFERRCLSLGKGGARRLVLEVIRRID